MKFVRKYLFLIICVTIIPSLIAQKKVMLVQPKSELILESLYEPIKKSLTADNKIEVGELRSFSTWKDIKDSHGKNDPTSIEDREDYFQGPGINYYILITQKTSSAQKETFKNTVTIYSDENKFEISWISKKDGQHYRALLKFNLGKIKYCISNNVEKKDLVLIRTTNNIKSDDWKLNYKDFGVYFKDEVESVKDIYSKYSFNPILNTRSVETEAAYISYDIKLEITLSEKENFVIIEIRLEDDFAEVAKPIFRKQYSHKTDLQIFCSVVVKDFLKLNKAWLLKDHSL